jgi:uncharacterized protein (DUF58 family)
MTVFPHARLLRLLALWTGFAAVVVALPWLAFPAAAAALLLAALVAWDFLLLRRVPALAFERRLPERFFVGREAEVFLVLSNAGAQAAEAALSEDLPPALADESPTYRAVPVDAGAQTTIRYAVTPRRRGDARFGAAVVLQRSPLGLLRRRLLAAGEQVARVYPDASRFLRPEALQPRLVFASIGIKPQRERGEGMEFESLRDYVPGDDPRRIHWGASARRGRPVVRQTQHERHHTIVVAVDASRLMASRVDGRTKLDFAADAALALSYGALASGDRVGMALFDDAVRGYLAPRSHRRDLGQFVDFLRDAEPRLAEASYGALAATLAARQRQRALLVVLTDFVDVEPRSFIAPLTVLGRRHRVLLVAIRDRIYQRLEPQSARGGDVLDLYRRLVLDDLLHERETALLTLRRAGVHTLDLPPEQLTAAVLNRYLAMRGSGVGG